MSAPFELIFHDTKGIPEDRGFSRGSGWYDKVPKDYMSNLKYRKAVYHMGNCDPGFAKAQIEICRLEPLYWMNVFCWTYDPRLKVSKLPFITFDLQDELVYELHRALGYYDVLIEKSRDMGASWLCLATLGHQFQFERGQQFSVTSRVADMVDKRGDPDTLFWKLEYLYKNAPRWMKPDYIHTEMNLTFVDRENVIKGESATGNVGRGGRNRAMFMDEFSAFNRDDGYKVLASSADNTGCRMFNGTPQGTGNAFYDVREKNINKKTGSKKKAKILRAHWSEDPRKNAGLYVGNEKTGEITFLHKTEGGRAVAEFTYPAGYEFINDGTLRSHWYDEECERRIHKMLIAQELDIDYLSSSFQFFESAHITLLKEQALFPTHIGRLDFDLETFEFRGWVEDPDGPIKLWFNLDEQGLPPSHLSFAAGIDISAGTGASNSCFSAADTVTGEKMLDFATPNIRPEKFGDHSTALGYWLNEAFLIWESNGPGRQFGARVVENGYSNIYYRRNEESIRRKTGDIPGWSSTAEKKYQLFSEYRDALHEGHYTNFDEDALMECLQYIQEAGPKVVHQAQKDSIDPTGAQHGHGDRVVGDCLSWHGIKELRGGNRMPVKEDDDPTNPDEYAPASSVGGRAYEATKNQKDSDGWQ